MSMQNFLTIEKGMQDYFLPAWGNQIGNKACAFMASIEKENFEGGKAIYTAAEIGYSGGFGFGSEGKDNAPIAGEQRIEGFEIPIRDMYTTIELSDKAIRLSTRQSLLNAFETEINAAYKTAEWNVARALFGKEDGKLATFGDVSGQVASVSEVNKIKEGFTVDLHDGGTIQKVRVIGVDRKNKKVAFDKALTVSEGFITIQGSYGKELIGLGALLDEEAEIYGNKRTDNNNYYLRPVIDSCDKALGVTDIELDRVLRIAEREKGSKVNMLMFGDKAYEQYVRYLRETNRRADNNVSLEGGFNAIKYSYGTVDINIVNEQFVPENEVWGVDTTKFKFKATPWEFVAKEGAAFSRMEGSSNFQALLASYGNLVCSNPGGCIKLTDCNPAVSA